MPYSIPFNQRVQLRRDISANWTAGNPTLKSGEIGYETDSGKVKIGNGSTSWTDLAYSFTISLGDGSLGELGDVTIANAQNGDFLRWNGTAWINDAVNLSTDTVGSYVQSLVAGSGITITNNSGEAATPTVAVDTNVIQSRVSNVTDTEIGYLDGVTSAIQTQINTKAPTASPTFTGTVTLPSGTVASSALSWTYYNTEEELPSASANHGMFAHVHSTGAAYYAHAGAWYKLAKQTDLDLKAPLASPTFTGTPTLPTGTIATTQSPGNNTTAVATTAFVTTAIVEASIGGATIDYSDDQNVLAIAIFG